MKTYKTILSTLIGLECAWVLIAGNSTIKDLIYITFIVLITGFFRIYYKESYKYFTRYEPSRYDESNRISQQSKSTTKHS